MRPVINGIGALSRAAGFVSGAFLVLIVVLIMVEIVLRSLFNASTLISDEYSAYFFVAVVMLGLALAMRDGAHIRITLLPQRLGPRMGRALEAFTFLLAAALCTFVLYHSILMTYDAFDLGMTADSISETPIYLPQIMIPMGLLLFDLQLLAGFLDRLIAPLEQA